MRLFWVSPTQLRGGILSFLTIVMVIGLAFAIETDFDRVWGQTQSEIADDFDTEDRRSTHYAGNDGALAWDGNWTHVGQVYLSSYDGWCATDYCLRLYASRGESSSERHADLSSVGSATLHFVYTAHLDNGGSAIVELSNDGIHYDILATLNEQYPAALQSYPIPPSYLNSGFRLRFRAIHPEGVADLFVDDVVIQLASGTATPTPSHTPIPPTSSPSSTPTPTSTSTRSYTSTPTRLSVTPTMTPSPTIQSIRFAVIGDYGNGSPEEGEVAALINQQLVSFVATVGDNRYGGLSFDRAVGQYYCSYLNDVPVGAYCAGGNRTRNAFFPALGNHDYNDGGGINEYLNYFTLPGNGIISSGSSGNERYYDVIQGPVHLFFLDSTSTLHNPSDMTNQRNWLQTQLATATTATWKLVFLHHPPYSSSSAHGSHPALQWPFAQWGAHAVLAGHDHTYERILRDGIVYYVNGLGGKSRYRSGISVEGSQIQYREEEGAMIVDATDGAIQFRFVNRSGGVVDSYQIFAP